jgi:hypothetical protein
LQHTHRLVVGESGCAFAYEALALSEARQDLDLVAKSFARLDEAKPGGPILGEENHLHLAMHNQGGRRHAQAERVTDPNGRPTKLAGSQSGNGGQVDSHKKRSTFGSAEEQSRPPGLDFAIIEVCTTRSSRRILSIRPGARLLRSADFRVLNFNQWFAGRSEIAESASRREITPANGARIT